MPVEVDSQRWLPETTEVMDLTAAMAVTVVEKLQRMPLLLSVSVEAD